MGCAMWPVLLLGLGRAWGMQNVELAPRQLAAAAGAVPARSGRDECTGAQESNGCCAPLGRTASAWSFSTTPETSGGAWSSGDAFIRFDFANDNHCNGSSRARQLGTAILTLNESSPIDLTLSAEGVAEALYETFKLYVDNVLEVTVQATATRGGTACQASTCVMCVVDMNSTTFSLAAGQHEVRVEVDSLDGQYHSDAFFQIGYTSNSPTCDDCSCTSDEATTTTLNEDHASSRGDPHVCSLGGACFDIKAPSGYTLLRVPHAEEAPDMLRLSADIDADGVRPCGLYMKSIALSGSWLDGQVLRIRPYTRDVAGSNFAGAAARTNFSLQLGDAPWMSFTRLDSDRQLAVVGRVAIRFVWKEEFGQRVEAQSLELSVAGEGAAPALLTVLQASHQALNLDMWGLGRLGHARVAGVLGTEGHPTSIEKPSYECLAYTASAMPDAHKREAGPQAALAEVPVESASILRVSW